MTERILRALGETDERYFLAYAENMKVKNPKKIILRRWLSAAAVLIVLIGVVLSLPPVRQTFFQKKGWRVDFDSFEEMMERVGTLPEGYPESENIPYGTRLSLLDFSRFDNAGFYLRMGDWGDMSYTLAVSPPLVYICDLEKDGIRYEIANYQSVNSLEIPEQFRNTEKYPITTTVDGQLISYIIMRNRIECEFTDATGYYKIICHSGDLNDLYAILGKLLQYNFETWEAYP